MTAELFIKLSAQLYGESSHTEDQDSDSDSDPEPESPSSSDSEKTSQRYQSSHHESNGGVKISATPEEEEDLIDFDDITQEDSLEIESELKTQQWLPKMNSKFWGKYVNKLRVNSSEEGVCDLAERDVERQL